ncbi:hypothetical protein AYO47_02230 [Planctomyces sp. SCGC AG-212-M04]|nr:hypothetical protein AYO47_02230 [Planctomyces sp. SCGC AG-212-M04]
MTVETVLLLHFLAAVVMTAVIWFVQVVQYPLFAKIGEAEFPAYAAEYQWRIGWIVIGPMLTEVFTAAALAVFHPGIYKHPAFAIAAVLLAVVWASTFVGLVPLHQKLLQGKDLATIARLVKSNWLRTIAWTARAILVGWVLWRR